jgi:hypothetical protein
MARIENTSARRYEINWKGAMLASIPRCAVDEVTGVKVNGSAEIADRVVDEMLAGDDWTKAVFASGDLVRVGTEPSEPPAAQGDAGAPPVTPPLDPPPSPAVPSEPAPAASDKGKPKK